MSRIGGRDARAPSRLLLPRVFVVGEGPDEDLATQMRASRIRDADTDTDVDAGGRREPGAGSDGVAAVRLPGHVGVAGVGEGGQRTGAAGRIGGEREEIAWAGADGGGAASCERAQEPGGRVWRQRGEGDDGARWMRSRADESWERSFLFKSRERGLRLNHSNFFGLAL